MFHSTSVRYLCSVMLAVFALALPAASQAQSGYTIVDLGTLGGMLSEGGAINASGQVAGAAQATDGGTFHATVWTGTTATDLGTLGETESFGTAINASGQVAGFADALVGNVSYAVVWTGNTPTILDTLGGSDSYGYGINDNGQVAGYSYIAGNIAFYAVVWTGTTATNLGTLGGSNSVGAAINASGQVTGYSQTTGDAVWHTFRYSGSTMTDLDTLGGSSSYGLGINASGQVAGYSRTTGDAAWHAVVWTGTTATDLGTLGGTTSIGYAINAFGDVVGSSFSANDGQDAFLYSSGRMIDLNIFLPEGSDWQLSQAYGINDSGWITGQGWINGEARAYLLKPVASTGLSRIALEGVADFSAIDPAAPLGTFHVSLRTPGTTTELFGKDITLTPIPGSAFGTYTLHGIPDGTYDIAIKGSKSLRVLLSNFTIDGMTSLPDVTLPAGDANNDNQVDLGDFGLLVNAYGNAADDGTGFYDPSCDFNYDGVVNIGDFGLLVNEFSSVGAP